MRVSLFIMYPKRRLLEKSESTETSEKSDKCVIVYNKWIYYPDQIFVVMLTMSNNVCPNGWENWRNSANIQSNTTTSSECKTQDWITLWSCVMCLLFWTWIHLKSMKWNDHMCLHDFCHIFYNLWWPFIDSVKLKNIFDEIFPCFIFLFSCYVNALIRFDIISLTINIRKRKS